MTDSASQQPTETIWIAGLARGSGRIFAVWGLCVAAKGLWDAFAGEPESNAYSPEPWMFVTREQWFRYAGFEIAYGLACAGLAWVLFEAARRWPETIRRPRETREFPF